MINLIPFEFHITRHSLSPDTLSRIQRYAKGFDVYVPTDEPALEKIRLVSNFKNESTARKACELGKAIWYRAFPCSGAKYPIARALILAMQFKVEFVGQTPVDESTDFPATH